MPNRLYFNGKPMDETGLYYYGFRYYAPFLGRFMRPDPVIGFAWEPRSLHPYQFSYNSPLVYKEIMGLFVIVYEGPGRIGTLYFINDNGEVEGVWPAHNIVVGSGNLPIPVGEYTIPEKGWWLEATTPQVKAWAGPGRIVIKSGPDPLPSPLYRIHAYDPETGRTFFTPTHGCIRMRPEDLLQLKELIEKHRKDIRRKLEVKPIREGDFMLCPFERALVVGEINFASGWLPPHYAPYYGPELEDNNNDDERLIVGGW